MGVILPPESEAAKVDHFAKDPSAEGQERFKHEVDDYARKVGPERVKELTSHMTSDSAQKVLQELELVQKFDSKEINQAAKKDDGSELRAYTSQSSDKYLGSLELTFEAQVKTSAAKNETNTRTDVMYNLPPYPQGNR